LVDSVAPFLPAGMDKAQLFSAENAIVLNNEIDMTFVLAELAGRGGLYCILCLLPIL